MNDLLLNVDKLHTTELGVIRIRKNLGLFSEDVVEWCKEQVKSPESITRTGKNWYVRGDGFVLTINAHSFTIITAKKEKEKIGGSLSGVSIIKKLDDIPELKDKLIRIFDGKTHIKASAYGVLLAEHIVEIAGMLDIPEIEECYNVNRKWQRGEAGFQEARNAAYRLQKLAQAEPDAVKQKAFRGLAQVAATPHVKRHALIASDYAVKLINIMYPADFEEVKKERMLQIEMLESV